VPTKTARKSGTADIFTLDRSSIEIGEWRNAAAEVIADGEHTDDGANRVCLKIRQAASTDVTS